MRMAGLSPFTNVMMQIVRMIFIIGMTQTYFGMVQAQRKHVTYAAQVRHLLHSVVTLLNHHRFILTIAQHVAVQSSSLYISC